MWTETGVAMAICTVVALAALYLGHILDKAFALVVHTRILESGIGGAF